MRNVCKRGSKCRFSHKLPESEDAVPQDKRQRQHIETNNSYMNKSESPSGFIGGIRLDQQKEAVIKEKVSAGPPMQLKV